MVLICPWLNLERHGRGEAQEFVASCQGPGRSEHCISPGPPNKNQTDNRTTYWTHEDD
jgi:hypothetical protein